MSESTSDDDRSPAAQTSYRPTDNLAEELSLSQGEVLRARVVSKLPRESGKLVITVRGNRVLAESQLDVDEGQVLLVRVKSLRSPIELELIDPYDAPGELQDADLRSFLQRTELPSSDEDLEIFREWLDQSLPLDRSLLNTVLEDPSLVLDDEGTPDGDRLWATAFLHDQQIDPRESLVTALSQGRQSDAERDLTLFYRTNDGVFQPVRSGSDLQDSVRNVGFDLVRQMSRRPHRAAGTLHAQLLRDRNDTENSSRSALPDRLLGLILGVALTNLNKGNEFLFFIPLADGGTMNLIWLTGRVEPDQSMHWTVKGQMQFSNLGSVGWVAERTSERLNVRIQTSGEETIQLLKDHRADLRSILSESFPNLKLTFVEEEPDGDMNPFHARSVLGERDADVFVAPGLDLTV